MLTIYDTTGQRLVPHGTTEPITKSTVWVDLLDPSREEDNMVEDLLKIDVPTRAEMREIEASSRIYQENGATYMTAFIVHEAEAGTPGAPLGSTITFILTGQVLVTVRYADPKAFSHFRARLSRGETPIIHGAGLMAGLIEALIEQQADLVESVQDRIEKVAHTVFDFDGRRNGETSLENVLRTIGAQGDIVARAQESATTMDRVLNAFKNTMIERGGEAKLIQRIETSARDIGSLMENLRFLSERVSFLLNATLGFISTEQNQIIKLFSVMAVMLMPPTLVASVYGMNFEHMPELHWQVGYPLALLAMVISAVIPYLYFRHKGWL